MHCCELVKIFPRVFYEKEILFFHRPIYELCHLQHASDYLSPQMKNTEGLLRLHAYWAHLEIKLGKDITGARGIWESFLKIWYDDIYFNHLP